MARPEDRLTPAGASTPPDASVTSGKGAFDGEWYHEQFHGAVRFAVRAQEHLHSEHSEFQKIDVYQSEFFGKFLTLDNLMMLTERDECVYHEMLVHVPLLSMPAPRSVLVIGGGDMGCAREALAHPSVERVVQCDIDERVTRVCEQFFDWPATVASDPRLELHFADGAAFLRESEGAFDLIIVDSTDPIGPAVTLFEPEFYATARRALRPGGVLTAQTESPHWSARAMAWVHGNLRQVFPRVHPYLGSIPTYPSGGWSWAFASVDRDPHQEFDLGRAEAIAARTRYYTPDLQRGAFALPKHVQRALAGEDPFAGFGVEELPSGTSGPTGDSA